MKDNEHESVRVVMAGPESSGKSTLTIRMADRFGCLFALEYARLFLEAHGPAYGRTDVETMARGHVEFQDRCVPPSVPFGVFDTDLIHYKVWLDVAFGMHDPFVTERIRTESQHVYLLCSPDLPWEPDPLREHPTGRAGLFERYRAEIEMLGRPYEVIAGVGEERELAAMEAITRLTGRQPVRR